MFALKRSKRAFRSKHDRAEYLREIEMVSRLEMHLNIVTYYSAWQEDSHFWQQLEFCNTNLSTYVNSKEYKERVKMYGDGTIWDILFQLARVSLFLRNIDPTSVNNLIILITLVAVLLLITEQCYLHSTRNSKHDIGE